MPTRREDLDWYLNFITHATLGHMAEADFMMREHRDSIVRAAHHMCRKSAKGGQLWHSPLWRGVVLPEPGRTELPAQHERTFISFTESELWAKHFADPHPFRGFGGVLSGPLGEHGYVMRHTPAPADIVFHWRMMLVEPIATALAYGYDMIKPPGVRESGTDMLEYLIGQREVIVVQKGQAFQLEPFEPDATYLKFVKHLRKEGQ